MCSCRRFLHKGSPPRRFFFLFAIYYFAFNLGFLSDLLWLPFLITQPLQATPDRSPHSELFNLIASIFYVNSSFYISLHRNKSYSFNIANIIFRLSVVSARFRKLCLHLSVKTFSLRPLLMRIVYITTFNFFNQEEIFKNLKILKIQIEPN